MGCAGTTLNLASLAMPGLGRVGPEKSRALSRPSWQGSVQHDPWQDHLCHAGSCWRGPVHRSLLFFKDFFIMAERDYMDFLWWST